MSEKSEASVIGSLPHSRPQRRSDKRAPKPGTQPGTKRGAQPAAKPRAETPPGGEAAQPEAAASEPSRDRHTACSSSLPDGAELIGTVVRAAAELTEIGLTIGARALRTAVSRLPRP